jgi:site-specific DNA-methyltransferase (adenine-specific)
MKPTILHGDCIELMALLPEASIDAVVTDPPYGLEFMGKEWDRLWDKRDTGRKGRINGMGGMHTWGERPTYRAGTEAQAWHERWAREAFRVLKPGSHLLACGSPRTYHRMASAIEDAGFEIRDCLAWLYGSGFPKSLNLGEGLGTALKPAYEPIVLARKPFKGTVAGNVQQHGTGALNIDACRLAGDVAEMVGRSGASTRNTIYGGGIGIDETWEPNDQGRWPANVCLDDLAAMVLDEQSGETASGAPTDERGSGGIWNRGNGVPCGPQHGDRGGASRFFYVAKPSREERDYGCDRLPIKSPMELTGRKEGSAGLKHGRAGTDRAARNYHPTVKPVELMRWLVRLVTPINGTVLDPFLGSGTTGMACRYELRNFIGIEREAEYIAIAERRIAAVAPLFSESA